MLAGIKRNLDAIDDFTKAIALDHDDCNIYYLRAISREAVGDLEGVETDIKKAVLLSQRDSKLNRAYNDYAGGLGYTSVGDLYSWRLRGAKGRIEIARQMRKSDAERAQVCGNESVANPPLPILSHLRAGSKIIIPLKIRDAACEYDWFTKKGGWAQFSQTEREASFERGKIGNINQIAKDLGYDNVQTFVDAFMREVLRSRDL